MKSKTTPVWGGGGQPQVGAKTSSGNLTRLRRHPILKQILLANDVPRNDGDDAKAFGFTLAEVLITLGIIGIIAALTIPSLVHSYRISVAETSLKRFYSNINEAIRRSEVDNGDKITWYGLSNENQALGWYDTYLDKYLKTTKVEMRAPFDAKSSHTKMVYTWFVDGTVMQLWSNHDFFYCLHEKDLYDIVTSLEELRCFQFGFYPTDKKYVGYYYKLGVEPYVNREFIDGSLDISTFYSKRIQLNGWKIPEDLKDKVK